MLMSNLRMDLTLIIVFIVLYLEYPVFADKNILKRMYMTQL